jgi:hypothetical protein
LGVVLTATYRTNLTRYEAIYSPLNVLLKNEIGWACDTHGVEERCVQGFGWHTLGKGTLWKTRLDGRIILE